MNQPIFPHTVLAYIGPGAGLSAIGALLAVVMAIIVAAFGFVWYPTKKLLGKLRPAEPDHDPAKGSGA